MLKKGVLTCLVFVMCLVGGNVIAGQHIGGGLEPLTDGSGNRIVSAYVNPNNLGDALIYGYYNVRNAVDLIRVVNTDANNAVLARVVFRNAKNSKECLDFTLCLSAGDEWSAFLVDNGVTAAVVPWDDDTLTGPAISKSGQQFKFEGAGGLDGVTADDCKEGYFEIIGMYSLPEKDFEDNIKTADDCVEATSTPVGNYADVANVLYGQSFIADVTADGSNLNLFGYSATAIADTTVHPFTKGSGKELSVAQAADSNVAGINFILAKKFMIFPYDISAELLGKTEAIITFPTKIDNGYTDDNCTPIEVTVWDDEENQFETHNFSPSQESKLCNEVNVLRVGATNGIIWDSPFAITAGTGSFTVGWMKVKFDPLGGKGVPYDPSEMEGAPVIGYYTQTFFGDYFGEMLEPAYTVEAGK